MSPRLAKPQMRQDSGVMLPHMPLYRVREAADLLGVSVDTVRRWADAGRLATTTDEAGHRSIEGTALAEFAVAQAQAADTHSAEAGRSSMRNRFPGIVTRVLRGDVAAQVEVQAGPHRFVSLLTREAVDELDLQPGDRAVATVKSTNVAVDLP
jgi:molybdopterin-binding protein